MDLGAATHVGHVRSDNEDGFFASGEQAVFAVADGMGGHEGGEVASHLALDAIVRHADALAAAQATELPGVLHRTIQEANNAIRARSTEQQAEQIMGTTIVTATLHGDRLYFAHIGDSRLYLLRGELFTQLTRDHSLVQAMVDNGELTPDEAAIHPLRHQITRVVGYGEYVSPEIASQALEPGDLVLLCTDGLSGVVSQDAMRGILTGNATCQEKADALIQAALRAGGPDNITAVVVEYQRPRALPEEPAHPPFQAPHFNFPQALALFLLVTFVALCAVAHWSYGHPQYILTVNTQEQVVLGKRWPGLPMLAPELVSSPADALPLKEVEPYLPEMADLKTGLAMENKDAGVYMLHDLRQQAAEALFVEINTALEAGDFPTARAAIARARTLGADKAQVDQLEQILRKKERETE